MKKLVFLHGWVNKYIINKDKNIEEFYQDLLSELKKYFEVHFVILPGFSNNPEPLKEYFLDDYVEYVKNYVELNKLNNFYLMGHSFGGQIACKFAYLYPEKVEKLILYNAACIRKESIKQKLLKPLREIGQSIFKIFPFLKKAVYKFLTGSTYYLQLSPIMQKTYQNVIKEDLTPLLEKIKVQTIIIWGAKDRITPLWQGKLIKKLIPDSQIFINNSGDHNFHKKNPKFIIGILKSI